MAALEEKLAEAVRQFPVLYDKSCRDFKDNSKKRLAWDLGRRPPWFLCRRLLRRMSVKSNNKSSNLSSSPGSAILNVYK